jgi:O-acetyl-ADP-ribose deacetylase (regulator of RNase III)
VNKVIQSEKIPSGQTLDLVQGDLTEERVDAIVNAANRYLEHGGGVAGAISRRGGPQIQAESDAWVRKHGPVSHSRPAWTRAGNLPSRYVIHAVGPVWGNAAPEASDAALQEAVRGSLEAAEELGVNSLSMPAISTGIFGFPADRAARLIREAVLGYFQDNPGSGIQVVRVVLFGESAVQTFQSSW